jgi:hypothetical protein
MGRHDLVATHGAVGRVVVGLERLGVALEAKVRPGTVPPVASRQHIDTLGLAHPGLLPQHWQRLQEAGVDLDPMLRSSERFLELWEQVRQRAVSPGASGS